MKDQIIKVWNIRGSKCYVVRNSNISLFMKYIECFSLEWISKMEWIGYEDIKWGEEYF